MDKKDKNLIAYCGLYCKECFYHKGEIADLARDLRKKLREVNFDEKYEGVSKFMKEFKNYPQCYNVLGAMVKMRCPKTCRNGGGPPFCKIRKCCQDKGMQGCWECSEFEICKNLDFLKPIHNDIVLTLNKFKNGKF